MGTTLDQCTQSQRTPREPAYKNTPDLRLGRGLYTPHTLIHALPKTY